MYAEPGRLELLREERTGSISDEPRAWSRAGPRFVSFFNCPGKHENALACGPSAGQPTAVTTSATTASSRTPPGEREWRRAYLCARDCNALYSRRLARRAGIFRRDLRKTPSRLISRSRMALDVLETVARRRFQADLLRGITPTKSSARTSSLLRCSHRGTLPVGCAGSRVFRKVSSRRWCFISVMPRSVSERDPEFRVLLGSLERSGETFARAISATDSDILKEKYQTIFVDRYRACRSSFQDGPRNVTGRRENLPIS